jgi:RNA polymerase sigma-70 factor, ECF subfamily
MTDDTLGELGSELGLAWRRFVDLVAPERPALYAYCRRLTGSVWDAEDLAQDSLLRAFGRWGVTYPPIKDPRAYLLRTATNVWIDALRHRQSEAKALLRSHELSDAPHQNESLEFRDASAKLLRMLSPQEQAALVLKEAFDMSLEEIANMLSTTTGAVKAALHRGRERLQEGKNLDSRRPVASSALIDKFIHCFEARDVDGLLSLMRDGAVAENVGNSLHRGNEPNGLPRFVNAVVNGHPDWPPETQFESARMKRVEFEGEQVVLVFVSRKGREALANVFRFEASEGKISRLRAYGFCPDTIRAVGEILGLRVFTGLYRAPTPKSERGSLN